MRRAFVRGVLLAPFIFAHETLKVVGAEGEVRVNFAAECPPKKDSSSSLPYFMGGCPKHEVGCTGLHRTLARTTTRFGEGSVLEYVLGNVDRKQFTSLGNIGKEFETCDRQC